MCRLFFVELWILLLNCIQIFIVLFRRSSCSSDVQRALQTFVVLFRCSSCSSDVHRALQTFIVLFRRSSCSSSIYIYIYGIIFHEICIYIHRHTHTKIIRSQLLSASVYGSLCQLLQISWSGVRVHCVIGEFSRLKKVLYNISKLPAVPDTET